MSGNINPGLKVTWTQTLTQFEWVFWFMQVVCSRRSAIRSLFGQTVSLASRGAENKGSWRRSSCRPLCIYSGKQIYACVYWDCVWSWWWSVTVCVCVCVVTSLCSSETLAANCVCGVCGSWEKTLHDCSFFPSLYLTCGGETDDLQCSCEML